MTASLSLPTRPYGVTGAWGPTASEVLMPPLCCKLEVVLSHTFAAGET